MLPATSPLVQQRISYATQVSASFISLSRVIKRALGSNVRKSSKVQGPYVALSEQQKAPHREARKAPAGKRHVAQSATREAPLTWCPSQVLLCECNELCDNQYQQMRCRSVESTVHVHIWCNDGPLACRFKQTLRLVDRESLAVRNHAIQSRK